MDIIWFTAPIPLPSAEHQSLARRRQEQLTKPPGSLGRLEGAAIALAGLQRTCTPSAERVPIIVFAGDHGVVAQGVSAYPAAVTVEMLKNFSSGGAAISVLARVLSLPLSVVDAGSLLEGEIFGVHQDKPRRGARDFTSERALTPDEVAFALGCGRRGVDRAASPVADVLILGEMGIGNTTSAAAIACALTGRLPGDVVGVGTGIDAAGLSRKLGAIEKALALHFLAAGNAEPLDILEAVGGLEIAALTGAIIASAQAGIPVLVDGFIVSVAALIAVRINPSCRPWLLYSHCSAERGHRIVLEALAANPILDLEMRLGEGSGAAIALPILRLACALHNGMATFEQAAVSGRIGS